MGLREATSSRSGQDKLTLRLNRLEEASATQNFRALKVWQRSHRLTVEIYQLTRTYPSHEQYGVTSQLRRAAVSVPSNIAEGSKRRQPRDYARFLNLAESSLAEVEYLLILSQDLGYLPPNTAAAMFAEIEELSRMLNGLRAKVESGSPASPRS